jgi:uncharacterized membrane protein YgcG
MIVLVGDLCGTLGSLVDIMSDGKERRMISLVSEKSSSSGTGIMTRTSSIGSSNSNGGNSGGRRSTRVTAINSTHQRSR